jgi:hypothetical protein
MYVEFIIRMIPKRLHFSLFSHGSNSIGNKISYGGADGSHGEGVIVAVLR